MNRVAYSDSSVVIHTVNEFFSNSMDCVKECNITKFLFDNLVIQHLYEKLVGQMAMLHDWP